MNKQITLITIILTLFVGSLTNVSGQKIMMLDSTLKVNSTPMEAKRNFAGSVGRYQFGSYKIVSGKAGLTYGKSKTIKTKDPTVGFKLDSENHFLPFIKLFNTDIESETNSKLSFLFVANEIDSVTINTSTNTKSKSSPVDDETSALKYYNQVYSALISAKLDTTVWKMIIVTLRGSETDINSQPEGLLTDGVKMIGIRKVKKWDNDKNAMFNIGYEFWLDNQSIAAVQASPDTFIKRYVWLNQNLDPYMKIILSAASASILVRLNIIE